MQCCREVTVLLAIINLAVPNWLNLSCHRGITGVCGALGQN